MFAINFWRMQNLIQYQALVQEALRQSHQEANGHYELEQIIAAEQKYHENTDYVPSDDGSNSGTETGSVGKSSLPTPPKKKQCRFCSSVFKSNTDLRRHERIHTGEKPFSCSVCKKSFNRKGNMEKHMGTHFKGSEKLDFYVKHMSKQYACDCGKTFRSKGFYDRHVEKCSVPFRPAIAQLPPVKVDHFPVIKPAIFSPAKIIESEPKLEPLYKCHACDMDFATASGLTGHFTACKAFAGPIQVDEDEEINVDL